MGEQRARKKGKATSSSRRYDLTDPRAIEEFKKAVAAFDKSIKTKEEALRLLVTEGIYTRSGKLTKNYR